MASFPPNALRRRRAWSPHQVRFIVVAGPPCSGKSTVASHLSRALDVPHLERDDFHRRLLPESDHRVRDRDLVYRAMHLTAERIAPWCPTLIVDATYTAAACRDELLQVVERTGGSLVVIECHVDAAEAVERFSSREAHPAADLTPARVAALAAQYPYCPAARAVRATDDPAALVELLQRPDAAPLDGAGLAAWRRAGQPVRSDASDPSVTF